MNNKVIIYTRVAVLNQENNKSVSIENQIKKCKEYAERNNLEVISIIKDTGSARSLKMKETVIDFASENDIPYILVTSHDRWSRDIQGFQAIQDNDLELITTESNDLFNFSLKKAVNQHYSRILSEAIRLGLQKKGMPLGYSNRSRKFRKGRLNILEI